MPPKTHKEDKPVKGQPRELVARIEHLRSLLRNLPQSLPENPPDSPYRFYLDPEKVDDIGYLGELGHALEVSFQTHLLHGEPILFRQRESNLEALPALLKTAVKNLSEKDRGTVKDAWIERLITAAVASGAKIPSPAQKRKAVETVDSDHHPPQPKKSKPDVVVVDESSDDEGDARPSTSAPRPIGNPKQTTLQFQKGTKEDVQRYWTKATADGKEKREAAAEAKQRKQEGKKEHERELARERQRKSRARRKQLQEEDSDRELPDKKNANKVLMHGAEAVAGTSGITDMADVSRPYTTDWKKSRTGTQAAVRRQNWSAGDAVKDLHRSHPQLFNAAGSTLHRATLWKWIVAGERRFTEAALRNVVNRRSLGGSGRVGVLAKYPEVVKEITTTLRGLRASGCVVNVPIARSLMLAIINKRNPAILAGARFACSEKFVRSFLESILDWSSRKATRAAKHIPENAGELCERTFFRAARKALRKYLETDSTLADEIRARCGATHLNKLPLDIPEADDSLPESNLDNEVNHDDYDVPLADVVRESLGDGLSAPSTSLPVSAAGPDPETEGLSATNDEEDIWAFDDQGHWIDAVNKDLPKKVLVKTGTVDIRRQRLADYFSIDLSSLPPAPSIGPISRDTEINKRQWGMVSHWAGMRSCNMMENRLRKLEGMKNWGKQGREKKEAGVPIKTRRGERPRRQKGNSGTIWTHPPNLNLLTSFGVRRRRTIVENEVRGVPADGAGAKHDHVVSRDTVP
ncbi:hypothetical protein R3P38DRAFT_2808824 [Favolaschia claudopus]|uniref:Uncharacterized protein n=1 Tax=Favolaschia claudopus TaxID=2862362 RepID=A0AAV9ZG36_9AGAR